MMHELAILDGEIVDFDVNYSSDIGIDNGMITEIGPDVRGIKTLYASGKLIFPGFVDQHVHLRYGQEHKEDFYTGSQAAIHGGVTTVFDMPNTKPPIDSLSTLREKKAKAAREGKIDIRHYGLVLQSSLDHLSELAQEADALKIFVGPSTGGGALVLPYEFIPKAIESISPFSKVVSVHCEDQGIINENQRRLQGKQYPELHCDIRSPKAESVAIKNVLALSKGCKINIAHLSTIEGLNAVIDYRERGYPIYCEVTPHHLLLHREWMKKLGNYVKMNPPLRSSAILAFLRSALRQGLFDSLATDHASHTREEKESSDPPSGVTGLDTFGNVVSLLITKFNMTPQTLMRATSYNPAKIFGLEDRGRIEVGKKADITILDLKRPTKITEDMLYTKCRLSPFIDWEFPGAVMNTIFNGEIVSEYDQVFV